MTDRFRPIKILLLGYLHGRGGIQNHTHYLASGLGNRGHNVTVLSPQAIFSSDQLQFENIGYSVEIYAGIFDAWKRATNSHYDVAVMSGMGWKASLFMIRLRRPCKKGFFEVMSGARTRRLDPRALFGFWGDFLVSQARPVQAKFVENFGWSGPSISIPACPEPLEISCEIPKKYPRKFSSTNPIRMAYFGRLAEHKGVDMLIEHWSEFASESITLDIWGRGPHESFLSRKIRSANLENQVRLMGSYPSGSEYVELLQKYDLKLLPTVGDEGAPLVLLEAMACGLPFVANGVGGIPDYSNPDCLITKHGVEEFVPLVKAMLGRFHDGTIDNIRLQTHYQNHFSYQVLLDKWESYLLDLAS